MKLTNIIIILAITMAVSCKKFVDVPPPQDQIISEMIFTTDNKAFAAVNSIYGNMINGGTLGFIRQQLTVYSGFSSDEMIRFNATSPMLEFINNDISSANGNNKVIWTTLYQTIYYCNSCKEGLENATALTPSVKETLIAEVKLIRSFCHFYLVNLYGDVPLVTSTDYQTNSLISRTKTDEVYNQTITDLIDAENILPSTFTAGERNRPTKWAAKALLARVFLFRGNWTGAELKATEVINSGLFTPLLAPNTVFLKNSREAIWQLMPNTGIIPELREMRPSGNVPKSYLTQNLLNIFQPGDLRRKQWIDSVLNTGSYYYYPMKYRNTSATVLEYYMVLRSAEQYLIRAEARNNLDKLSLAIDDINVIRLRAGLNTITVSGVTKADVARLIETERRKEFFAELGHRWLDLKRTGKLSETLMPIKSGWQKTDSLYPIPIGEMLTNPNMVQNPGY
jgi:hypothetical protein